MTDILWAPLSIGLVFSLMAGPLGTLMVWRRLSFLGDTLSHGAILGVALAFFFHVFPIVGVFAVATLIGLALTGVHYQSRLGLETLLAIFSHAALACGLVALSLIKTPTLVFQTYLFGDLLTASPEDGLWLGAAGALGFLLLWGFWNPLMTLMISDDLAHSEGLHPQRLKTGFIVVLSLIVSLSLHLVGALLLTTLFIIPAATARLVSHSPQGMMTRASCFGGLATLGGFQASVAYDLPTSPAIAVVAFIFFVGVRIWGSLRST